MSTTTSGSGVTSGGDTTSSNGATPGSTGANGPTSGQGTTATNGASAGTTSTGTNTTSPTTLPDAGGPGTLEGGTPTGNEDASRPDAATSDAGADGGDAPATDWASGGTSAMTDIDSYPDPFAGSSPTACALFASTTLGPCYDAQAPDREDVSEGMPGLPMRLALRILDENCEPVTDANVDIWQTHALGLYSGNPDPGGAFCTDDDAEAVSSLWFRGHQATDQNGVAWFNSCFPGWYGGRAIHTHFTVRRMGHQGPEHLTSQLAYPDDLTEEICGNHPDYASRGQPDTSNSRDGVFPNDYSPFTVETQRTSDGALLAWKTIIIGSSPSGGGGFPF